MWNVCVDYRAYILEFCISCFFIATFYIGWLLSIWASVLLYLNSYIIFQISHKTIKRHKDIRKSNSCPGPSAAIFQISTDNVSRTCISYRGNQVRISWGHSEKYLKCSNWRKGRTPVNCSKWRHNSTNHLTL